jgi:hypothetical protein
MKRWLTFVLVLSVPALAQEPNPPAASSDGPGSGLMLELNVLGANSFTQIDSVTGGAAANLIGLSVSPTAAVGYQVNQNAFLLGIGFAAAGTGGTTIGFGISPTYRRYLQPLQTMHVIPFAQGTIGFGIVAPSSGSSDYIIGLGGGGGAEWLFTTNIGLIADAEFVYAHLNNGSNFDSFGFQGLIGLTIHF